MARGVAFFFATFLVTGVAPTDAEVSGRGAGGDGVSLASLEGVALEGASTIAPALGPGGASLPALSWKKNQ